MNGIIISCIEHDMQRFTLVFPLPIEFDEMTKICKLVNDYFDGDCVMGQPAEIKWTFNQSHYWITLPNSYIIFITKFRIQMKDLNDWNS